jgi:hypothetical protein
MKEDEKQFLLLTYQNKKISPRDIINGDLCDINHKRCWYLLAKWANKGWYDYGVTLDLGLLTDKGIVKAEEIIGA